MAIIMLEVKQAFDPQNTTYLTLSGKRRYECLSLFFFYQNDVIKWKHFPRYWPFVRGIHRSPVNSPHKGQWRGAVMLSLICVWISGWVNNREAGDLRRYRAHYDVSVMLQLCRMGVRMSQFPKVYGGQNDPSFALLALCYKGNSTVTDGYPHKKCTKHVITSSNRHDRTHSSPMYW